MKTCLTVAMMALLVLACGTQPATPQAGRNDVPPSVVSMSQPAYPEEARKAGIEGTAIVQVTVATDGAVSACSLAASSGNGPLDAAALEAARESKFTPGTADGKPAEMKVKLPFKFKLGDKFDKQHGEAAREPNRTVRYDTGVPLMEV